MILNYKTAKLPPSFIYLGIMLFLVGIWRIIVSDWFGILIFIISLLLVFIRSGILIDTDKRRLKKYIGFLIIKLGEWESINSVINLQIIKTRETQGMNVLSISRTEVNEVYKLFLVLPEEKIELMAGEEDLILNRAEKISAALQTSVENNIK